MDRQEYWRQRYREIRPGWTPTTAIYARLVDELVHHDTRVLDIGCGHADLLGSSLARTTRVVGIDVDDDNVPAEFKICSLLHVTAVEPLSVAGPRTSESG